jgi:4-amino-4-deoxy-L-arabinose transferase-like glycosyltransferase
MMKPSKPLWIFIIFLALTKLLLPFILQSPIYEPHRDEFLYLAEGHHSAWGFMEVPPLLSVFAWLTNLFGGSMFWIKFWPSLFGSLTFIIIANIVLSLGGRSFALFLSFLPFIFGAFLRIHFLFQPNFIEVFFWTMLAYSLIRFVQSQKNAWLYVFGISAGLGMMSKYSVAFFIVSLLTGILLTPQRKILFANKHFWFAVLIGAAIFLPNVLWQFQNHLPVIHHMKQLQKYQLQYVDTPSFLVDQVLMNLPCVFIWMAGLWFAAFTTNGKRFRFIAWAYVIMIALLIALHGKNYYAIGAYPVLFAVGAFHLEQFTSQKRIYLRYVFVAVVFLIGVPFVPALLPTGTPQKLENYYKAVGFSKTDLTKWEDLRHHPLPQDFSDMLGWEELTQKVAKAYDLFSPQEQKHLFIFCNNYGMAGAVNYYAPKYHLPAAYSDNASFLYWLPIDKYITNMILVTNDPHEEQHDWAKGFQQIVKVDSITNFYARERGDYIYLFKGADKNFNHFFDEKIEKDKAEFNY